MKALNKNSIIAGMLLGSMVIAGGAMAGVADSKHNLGSTNERVGENRTDATNEVCVFCHTPHGSDSATVVPLWNKKTTTSTFTTYDSLGTSSLDGDITAVGSVSIACLSCHDGSQAMDVMLNTPGSGDPTLTGSWTAGAGTVVAGVIDGLTTGKMTNVVGGGEFPMLGTDLQNDHPIGIQYAGGGISTSAKTPGNLLFGDQDFVEPKTKPVNGVDVWWIDTDATPDGKRQKTDLPLYTRTATGGNFAGEAEPFVECATCHDPHESTNKTFLRIPNTGSALCLACHDK